MDIRLGIGFRMRYTRATRLFSQPPVQFCDCRSHEAASFLYGHALARPAPYKGNRLTKKSTDLLPSYEALQLRLSLRVLRSFRPEAIS